MLWALQLHAEHTLARKLSGTVKQYEEKWRNVTGSPGHGVREMVDLHG